MHEVLSKTDNFYVAYFHCFNFSLVKVIPFISCCFKCVLQISGKRSRTESDNIRAESEILCNYVIKKSGPVEDFEVNPSVPEDLLKTLLDIQKPNGNQREAAFESYFAKVLNKLSMDMKFERDRNLSVLRPQDLNAFQSSQGSNSTSKGKRRQADIAGGFDCKDLQSPCSDGVIYILPVQVKQDLQQKDLQIKKLDNENKLCHNLLILRQYMEAWKHGDKDLYGICFHGFSVCVWKLSAKNNGLHHFGRVGRECNIRDNFEEAISILYSVLLYCIKLKNELLSSIQT